MNILKKIIAVCAVVLSTQATSYVYLEEGVKLPLPNGDIVYSGTPLKVISKNGDSKRVQINGFVDKNDKTKLYATKNLKLLFVESKSLHIEGDRGNIEVVLSNVNITDDFEEAWDMNSERFYDKCTKCHAAKVVGDHSMLEWESLFGSMRQFAKPTKEDEEYILRFLKAFAKDGILKEQ